MEKPVELCALQAYIMCITIVSQINTTPQHMAAIPIMLMPRQAAMIPTTSARTPANGICGAAMIAGKVMTARVTYGT